MYRISRILTSFAGVALGAVSVPGSALAQTATFPDRPVRIVLSLPAGGGIDALVRLVAKELGDVLGQPVIVDNKPGGSGALAASIVAKSPADGYTLLVTPSSITAAPALQKDLPYKLSELAPVTQITRIPVTFAVSKDLPVRNLLEFVAFAKAQKQSVTFGSYGIGSASHIYGERLAKAAGTELLHVPFSGELPALNAMIGGSIQSTWGQASTLLAQEKAGKVRILAVTAPKRTPLLPNVPTFEEIGYKGMSTMGWAGLLAPTGTPAPVLQRIAVEVGKIVQRPDVSARIIDYGMEPAGTTPAQFAATIATDSAFYARAIKEIGVTPE